MAVTSKHLNEDKIPAGKYMVFYSWYVGYVPKRRGLPLPV